jgi:multisubunit Na+/H+ antiporter MnhG subunit
MSAETRQRLTTGFGQKRSSFRDWRGQRPFTGGLLTLLAGIPIMYVPYHNLTLGSLTITMSTTAGAGSLIIGVLLVVLGLTMWFQPHSRVFAGIAAILLVLVALVVSNFGGYMVGFLLGLIGGALGVSWAPGKPLAKSEADAGEPEDAGNSPAAARRTPSSPTYSSTPAEADRDSGGGPRGTAHDDLSVFGTASSTGADANHGNGRHRAG